MNQITNLKEHIKLTQQKRYDRSEPTLIKQERDKIRGSYYVRYKECDLLFRMRMYKSTEEEIAQVYAQHNQIDNTYFEPEIKFYPCLRQKDEPILFLTLVGTLMCLENLCWIMYIPYITPRTVEFVEKARFLYQLIEFRLRIFFDLKNNPQLLDSEDMTIRFDDTHISVNMAFNRIVGAHLDQLYMVINDCPYVESIKVEISKKQKDYIFKTFLEEVEFSLVLEKYNEFYARLIITPADLYAHQVRFLNPSKIYGMILHHKNDQVFIQMEDNCDYDKLKQNPMFIDFMFFHAYKQIFHAEIELKRNRLYDLFLFKEKAYSTLAELICDNYGNRLFENINVCSNEDIFDQVFEDEEEANLGYLYPPKRF